MTVASTTSRAQYETNGTTGPWTVNFYFLANTHLRVIHTGPDGAETLLELGVDYSVAGAGDEDGGTVSTANAYAAGGYITILRDVPLTQETDYTDQDAFPAEAHERALDKLTMIAQQHGDDLARTLKFSAGDLPSQIGGLPPAASRANKLLSFDSQGRPTTTAPAAQSATALQSMLADPAMGAGLIGFSEPNAYPAGSVGAALQAIPLRTRRGDGRYQVQRNRTIQGPDGERFIVRGVQMFDYLFCSYEPRADMNYRAHYFPPGKGPGTGISEPTYYARVGFKNAAHVERQITMARQLGANLIRVGVEPAVMFATVPFVDPVDGLTYPSDIEMLDTITTMAKKYGMVVQLQSSRDDVGLSNNLALVRWMKNRYYAEPHIWINPANELNGGADGGANVADPVLWASMMRQYVLALREDIPGQPAGTKFLNPVVIDPPSYAYRLDDVATTITTDPAFAADPNLIINIHYYPLLGETDFRGARLALDLTRWVNYLTQFCIVIGEAGIDNFDGRYDPDLDPGIPSEDLTTWAQMQAAATDFLMWSDEQCQTGLMQGVIGHTWKSWIPGVGFHGDNSMLREDDTVTTWGSIFFNYFLAPARNLLQARRALGAQFSTGAWRTGDIAEDAITNGKLANMASGTIKGRISAGLSDPEDLTSEQVLNIIAGLPGARVTDGTMGTPIFQAQGLTGSRAAAALINTGASDMYAGLYRIGTGIVGSISGNGGSGVIYATTSDYRLKDRIEAYDTTIAVKRIKAMNPVWASWSSSPETPREAMFLAHEIQELVPGSTTGRKDETRTIQGPDGEQVEAPIYQQVDYGRITPILAAGLKWAIAEIEALKAERDAARVTEAS